MKARLLNLWDSFRSSFWFVPVLMTSAAFALAITMPQLDIELRWIFGEQGRWIRMTPSSAQATLSSIAGAMVTSGGVVFSITIAALSVATSQFGSRLIRNFRNDSMTHVTLGAFVATSLYCLIVLATIRDTDDFQVPQLSVYLGILFAIICLSMLIFFVHNTAVSIQASSVIGISASELNQAIDRIFPERIGDDAPPQQQSPDTIQEQIEMLGSNSQVVEARSEGFLQAIDAEGLMQLAVVHELTLEVLCQPGEFLTLDLPIVKAWPGDELSSAIAHEIAAAFITGAYRTPRQDVIYAIDELVEVGVRALSPGINDPFTAMSCVERLAAALGRLAGREMPAPFRYDDEKQLRVIARPMTFAQAMHTAFDQIRQHAARGFCRVAQDASEDGGDCRANAA